MRSKVLQLSILALLGMSLLFTPSIQSPLFGKHPKPPTLIFSPRMHNCNGGVRRLKKIKHDICVNIKWGFDAFEVHFKG